MLKSGAELKQHLQELASSPGLSQVVPGHGAVITTNAVAAMNDAAARL